MRGRKLGSTLSISQIDRIVEMTKKGCSRPAIADAVGVCNKTVYIYQKKYA